MERKFAIAIHGGAGSILKETLGPTLEGEYKNSLENSLVAASNILNKGGKAIDAVELAVEIMENDPLFNAGKGSVMTHDGEFELDASIMDGRNRMAGAVCGIRNIPNPIKVARMVMTHSEHVLLSGKGARRFAEKMGFERVEPDYFFTLERAKQLKAARKRDKILLDHSHDEKHGTVGAVALDMNGDLAAATSTGGLTNKKFGRVGDSPLLGAGTWAENKVCAVSCTGQGEAFIRSATAYELAARIKFAGLNLENAAYLAIHETINSLGLSGGLIAVDGFGNIAMPFNTIGMYRASLKQGEKPFIGMFKN
ncbi:MAG: isoaspartyl peptidase/L-asparaginase [Saprospirales bacterium]|nr:MAG: isoaspartyl peptidase/L-asparaginase [Saprospirales bacterium]